MSSTPFINALGKSIDGAEEHNGLSWVYGKGITSRTWETSPFQLRTDVTRPDLEKGHDMIILKGAQKMQAYDSLDHRKRMLLYIPLKAQYILLRM